MSEQQLLEGMGGHILSASQFLGITPDQFLEGVGLMKAEKEGNSPGVAGRNPNVLRGFQESIFDIYSAKGIRENYKPISFGTLREIERKNPIVSAITNTRCMQMRPFSQKSAGDEEPGFRVSLVDDEAKPSRVEKEEMKELTDWFKFTGKTDFEGWEEREDSLLDTMTKMVRDYLTIDQIAIELRRDRGGKVVDFWVLDGSTIRRVAKSGYRGSKGDFDPRAYIALDTKALKELTEAKFDLIPEDMEKVAFVQQMNAKLVAAYTREDLIFDSQQKRTDTRYYGYGYPKLEQAMNAVTAFLFGLAYNAEAFNSGTLPKMALAFKDGNFSEEQLIGLQEQFIANFRGIQGPWRIPMFNTDVTTIDMFKSPRDMEYMKYLEFAGSLICAVMGIDPMEIGLRFQQAQQVLGENQGSRLHFSKNRGLNDMLGAIANVYNKILWQMKLGKKYKFEFTGIEPEDREQKSKIDSEAVKRDTTINELRARKDMPPLEHGDLILDPTYLQYLQGKEMEGQEGGDEFGGGDEFAGEGPQAPGGAENVFEEATDEAVDEMFKAKLPQKKARTLLI